MDASILFDRTRPASHSRRRPDAANSPRPCGRAVASAYATAGPGPSQDDWGPFPEPRAFERGAYVGRRVQRPVRAIAVTAVLAFIALVAFCSVVAVTMSDAATGTLGGQAASSSAEPESTPKAQWRQGAVPTLYQVDAAWASEPYGGGTLATHGCGPTALSMAYVALTGNADRDPTAMAAFAEAAGFLDDGITSWALMTEGAAQLGLDSRELPANPGAVREALLADHPVICSVGPGDFTTDGHFIVLVDANPDGTVSLRDPNSPERTARTWPLQQVLGQCVNLWELSR